MTSPEETGAGLKRATNWWGAFVIGLAGTILVTGIAPIMVTTLGAASIPVVLLIGLTGYLLCLFLSELSAMMPERTGGAPSYAYPAFKDRWPRAGRHLGGLCAWAYWLGWFPVAPLNMILASFYLANRFGLDTTSGFTPIDTPIAYWTVGIAVAGIVLVSIPAFLGIRFGTVLATVLAFLSIVPLLFVALAWIFRASAADVDQLLQFRHLDGSGFFAPVNGRHWLTTYTAYSFLLTWNVIAMEAAACYVGECKNPERDARIALNLEGGFGLLVHTLIPVAFVVVLGAETLARPELVDPNAIFVTFAGRIFPGVGEILNWAVALMLIVALALSALNAIMGCARSLHQMSLDGLFPRFFQHVNRHGVPDRAMLFNVVCAIVVVFLGGAAQIYTFSNVGYLASFIPVLIGYFILRRDMPKARRPVRLPEFMKYVAVGLAGVYAFIWLVGGILYAGIGHTEIYYFLGWAALLGYLPFYWYRTRVEDRQRAAGRLRAAPETSQNLP